MGFPESGYEYVYEYPYPSAFYFGESINLIDDDGPDHERCGLARVGAIPRKTAHLAFLLWMPIHDVPQTTH